MAEKTNLNAVESAHEENDVEVQYEELSQLIERVDTLEDTVNHITEQQGTLTHQLREYSESLNDITDTVDSLRETVEELDQQSDINDSRMNNISRSLDVVEENIQNTRGDIEETSDKLDRRLTAIENMMDLDEVDIAQAVKPNACELEQLTTVPEDARDADFDVRVQRAIAVYEQFQDISTPIKSGGKRVLSKDIKTYLNGMANTDIAYSQVQRVIDSFDEKTDDTYSTRQTSDGRAIIWNPKEGN